MRDRLAFAMWLLWLGGVVFAVTLAVGTALGAGPDAPKLTEIQHLRVQLQQAQEQLLQSQYQLAQCNAQVQIQKLNEGRAALEKELQTDGFVFDWTTLAYKPAEKPKAP